MEFLKDQISQRQLENVEKLIKQITELEGMRSALEKVLANIERESVNRAGAAIEEERKKAEAQLSQVKIAISSTYMDIGEAGRDLLQELIIWNDCNPAD